MTLILFLHMNIRLKNLAEGNLLHVVLNTHASLHKLLNVFIETNREEHTLDKFFTKTLLLSVMCKSLNSLYIGCLVFFWKPMDDVCIDIFFPLI